ncbi:hypothetical protein K439DRAFT_1620972 [Ramaria rubella]|nr:hypothetical protein K439DRAFT_1620972 [Ramaria rubella]
MSRQTSTNVVLPPIRTLFPPSSFHSSPSLSDEEMPFTPLKQRQSAQEKFNQTSHQQFPFRPKAQHGRRVSMASTTSSVPSLTFSPSPSPTPSPPPSSQRILLVPCTMQTADAVVITKPQGHTASSSNKTQTILLVGSAAISRVAREERKMHPYRIVREHCQ